MENEVNERYDYYLNRRNEFTGIRIDSINSLEKSTSNISYMILILSIVFMDKMSSYSKTIYIAYMIGFLLTIIFNIISYYFALIGANKKIDSLDENCKEYFNSGGELKEDTFWQIKAVLYLNLGSFVFCIHSIIAFAISLIEVVSI